MKRLQTNLVIMSALTLAFAFADASAADRTTKRIAKPQVNTLGDTATHEVGHVKHRPGGVAASEPAANVASGPAGGVSTANNQPVPTQPPSALLEFQIPEK